MSWAMSPFLSLLKQVGSLFDVDQGLLFSKLILFEIAENLIFCWCRVSVKLVFWCN